jgi:hypothetical protein
MKRLIAVVTCMALILTGIALPIEAHNNNHNSRRPATDLGTTGFTFPLSSSAPGQGSFEGTLRIVRFVLHDGKVEAFGIVSGTRVDAAGVTRAVVRTVSVPVSVTPASAAAPGGITTQQILPCAILHLELGPLDLDLLGLVIHLDQVVLDISAAPGAGNLLGNLLCAITNLLNGVGNLALLINLLNQLLDLLG